MSRFKVTRFDNVTNIQKKVTSTHKEKIFNAMKKILMAEGKTISKLRKRAKLEKVNLAEIHIQLTLYAMREHLRQCLKDVLKNKLP